MTAVRRLTRFALPGLLFAGCLALSASLMPYFAGEKGELKLPGQLDAAIAADNSLSDMEPSLDNTLRRNRLDALQRFDATLERPLFSHSRRPFVPKQPANAGPAPVDLGLSLKGVLYSGDSRVAVLMSKTGREEVHLMEGESHRGWTVKAIEPKAIVFERDGTEQRLWLDYEGQLP